MAEIGEQTIGDVDRAVRDAAHARPSATRGCGGAAAWRKRSRSADLSRMRRFSAASASAASPRVPLTQISITRTCTVASQRSAARHLAHDLYADIKRPARSVTADHIDFVVPRQCHETAREPGKPARYRPWAMQVQASPSTGLRPWPPCPRD